MYHIAAAVEAFGPWNTFKSTNVDGVGPVLSLAAGSPGGMKIVFSRRKMPSYVCCQDGLCHRSGYYSWCGAFRGSCNARWSRLE